MRLRQAEIFEAELPFKGAFAHSASRRSSSESIFVKLTAENGAAGFGESLPRSYVTGETQSSVFELLRTKILPRLLELEFKSYEEVLRFLRECDGRAPKDWTADPNNCAWAAAELALLDVCGHVFRSSVKELFVQHFDERPPYAAVLTLGSARKVASTLVKARLYGMTHAKLKVSPAVNAAKLRLARILLGKKARIRIDANMAWSESLADSLLPELERWNICGIEQPFEKNDFKAHARLAQKTSIPIIADESFNDRDSLNRILEHKAFDMVSVRASKCGGVVASVMRAHEALAAGLGVQLSCQVGESSLLSAANICLLMAIEQVTFAEGCYGSRLLRKDPAEPQLNFSYGGTAPALPRGPGFGVQINENLLRSFSKRVEELRKPHSSAPRSFIHSEKKGYGKALR